MRLTNGLQARQISNIQRRSKKPPELAGLVLFQFHFLRTIALSI